MDCTLRLRQETQGHTLKRKRAKYEAVLMDGSIKLEPGQWVCFHVDTQITPSHHQLSDWMRRIRGNFLADTFGVENDLIMLELADQFGTADAAVGGEPYRQREEQLRAEHSFSAKLERVKTIVRKRRAQSLADRLIQLLADWREVRNLLAHYPCWQEPMNDDAKQRTIALKLFIGDQAHIWEITEEQVAAWLQPLLEIRRELIRLRHEAIGAPAPVFVGNSWSTVGPNGEGAT
jgi:hypothetical protein